MLRVYLTLDGVQGYHEGCSCCSSTYATNAQEIITLYNKLENQKQELSILLELLEEYGDDILVSWFRIYEGVRCLQADKDAGIKYSKDKSLQGTWYKDSFDNLDKITKKLRVATKELSKTPPLFREYMKMVNS